MLAVCPPSSPAHPRGRSRQVSHAARARQASEERRNRSHRATFPERTSPSEKSVTTIVAPAPTKPLARPAFIPQPLTPPFIDHYDSPPSPPRSLEDQVHVAYAHDDIHLAKVLLLRLKGIHVTSPDDPRIAAVKDEDFDFCFFPHGRLLDEESEMAIKERQRVELEQLEERRRDQRLRDCERIWEQEKKRLRDAKTNALKRREQDDRRKAEEEQRRIAFLQESPLVERRAQTKRPSRPVSRAIVAYKLVSSSSSRDQEPFVYDSMPLCTPFRPLPKPQSSSQPKKSRSPFSRPLFDDSRTVPFSDVLASMQGPLFPPERRPTSPLSCTASQDRKNRREVELLDSLLKVVEWEVDERRRRKGKAPEKPPVRRRNSDKSSIMSHCAACSDTSSSTSTSSSSSRRSWLSFSSGSSSSASTAVTTPSSSPPKWFNHPPSPISKAQPKPWFLTPSSSRTSTPSASPIIHSCRPCTHLTPISPADGPLPISMIETTALDAQPRSLNHSTTASKSMTSGHADDAATPTGALLRCMSQLLDLAKGFQHAYMNAAMFTITTSSPSFGAHRVGSAFVVNVAPTTPLRVRHRRRLRRLEAPGARACSYDVRAFLDSPEQMKNSGGGFVMATTRTIRLRPYTPVYGDDEEDGDELDAVDRPLPRTVLPDPLPYRLYFKAHAVPPRSPLRAVRADLSANGGLDMMGRNGPIMSRIRVVENPALLRIKAAENLVGYRWDTFGLGMNMGMNVGSPFGGGMNLGRMGTGNGRLREAMMASGREKILQVGYEGIGRSRLTIEVHQEGARWRDFGW